MPLLKLSRLLFSQKKIHQNVWCSSPKFLNAWQGITYTPVIYKYFLWRYMSLIVEWFYWIYAMFLVFRKGLVILHFLAVSFYYQSYQYHSTISIVFILNWFCDDKILKKAYDMTDCFVMKQFYDHQYWKHFCDLVKVYFWFNFQKEAKETFKKLLTCYNYSRAFGQRTFFSFTKFIVQEILEFYLFY